MNQLRDIQNYARNEAFRTALRIPMESFLEFSLLGQGEYNQNYLFTHPVTGKKLVLRKNCGSQMHLSDQIGYEAHALEVLQDSHRTPRVFLTDPVNSFLVMEYLPGRPLSYDSDLPLAAAILGDIHSIKIPENTRLIRPEDPMEAILSECRDMASCYFHSEYAGNDTKEQLLSLLRTAEKTDRSAKRLPDCIINTELNSGNFLINGPGKDNYLIDWEKPLIGEAAQDLGHFLAPTTTLWKTEKRLTEDEKIQFLYIYMDHNRQDLEFADVSERTRKYETLTCLRGLSWCAMAFTEYQDPDRPLRNEETYEKIQDYLSPAFMEEIRKGYFT